jgi:hypothetical protein
MTLTRCIGLAALLVLSTTACATPTREPATLAEIQARAAKEAERACLHDIREEVWWRNWDERYMRPEIERICARYAGVGIPAESMHTGSLSRR